MGVKNVQLKQLCWKCSKSCNSDLCVWVRTLKKHYKGTIFDENGYIIECPKFIKDSLLYSNKEKADVLGVSLAMYNNYKARLKKHNLKLSVEDYVIGLKEKRKQKNVTNRKLYNQLRNAKRQIKKLGLNITPYQYIKEREEIRRKKKCR